MRYEKGSFVVVPNKEHLRGLEPIVQTIFFWLCSYADEYGTCYPSRTTLAKDCGVSIRSIDRAVEKLEEKNLLIKDVRRKNEKENLTNMYYITIPEVLDELTPNLYKEGGSDKSARGVATKTTQRTISNINYNTSEASSQVFNWETYLDGMLNHKRKDLNIIGFFLKTKGISYNTKQKAEVAIRRHLRAAKELSVFDKSEIGEKIRKLNYDFPKFTLETVIKELTK